MGIGEELMYLDRERWRDGWMDRERCRAWEGWLVLEILPRTDLKVQKDRKKQNPKKNEREISAFAE